MTDESVDTTNELRSAWVLLDDALQLLARAEAIVLLLGAGSEAASHQTYAADVASDLLRTLKEKLALAAESIQQGRRNTQRAVQARVGTAP